MSLSDEKLKQVIEALVFASDQPLPAEKIGKITGETSKKKIEEIIFLINEDYRETGRVFKISKIGGGYRFSTLKEYFPYLKELYKGKRKPRLSRAALETIAIIAYRQPVSRPEIESIRGVNIDGVVTTLLERKLIKISGRGKGPGKPLLVVTTPEFLNYFGINEITELPNIKEISEIVNQREVTIDDEAE